MIIYSDINLSSTSCIHNGCHRVCTAQSFDLEEYGTVGMDCCCAADVILLSLHLASISKVAVNTDNHMFEACKILQTKDEATFPILELAPCP